MFIHHDIHISRWRLINTLYHHALLTHPNSNPYPSSNLSITLSQAVEEDNAFTFSFPDCGSLGRPVIEIEGVTFGYAGPKAPPLFADVHLGIYLNCSMLLFLATLFYSSLLFPNQIFCRTISCFLPTNSYTLTNSTVSESYYLFLSHRRSWTDLSDSIGRTEWIGKINFAESNTRENYPYRWVYTCQSAVTIR